MMITGFHAQDGLYFERLGDGAVVIKREHPPGSGQLVLRDVLSPDQWASVVAVMSLAGESGGRFYDALKFHQTPRP